MFLRRGLSTAAWAGIVVALFLIGLGIGWAVGKWTAAPAKAATKTVNVVKTVSVTGAAKTVTQTITVTVGATKKPQYTFYFISHGGPGDPWWAPVIKGAELAGKLLGVKVIYEGPRVYSVKWLVDTLESAAAAHPDAIIITITNYKALDKPLRKVIAEGIPVIAVNVPDPRPKPQRIPYLAYVGQNETVAGYTLAKYVLKWFKQHLGRYPKGAVIAIHEAGHIGLEMRAQGIRMAFKQAGLTPPPKLYITTDITKAYNILKAYLEAHPNVEVVFTLGPLGTHPAMKLIEDLHLKGKVYIAAFDVDEKTLKCIDEGICIATVSQQPFAQGFLPVVFAYLYVKYGIRPPDHIPTGPTIITKQDLSLVMKQIKTTGGA